MSKKIFYITTPIYYVNGKPHIGHAYTNILCDTIARFRRFIGEEVFFLTGTDEHGTKVEKAAREQNKDPKAYVDELVPVFKQLWEILGIRYDGFIRTTDEQHKRIVQNTLRELEKKGEIYKASYHGWYCFPCESFWTELQLVEGKCPDCQREVQELSEDNYFFRMSKYQQWLVDTIQSDPEFILPEIRRNEILGFLKEPLEDLCITRPKARLAWGIEYPGSKDHVVYVWFDALMNYVTAVQYSEAPERFAEFWPADVHMIGKDILRHHAVYWPIMLKACGIEMPKTILAHGWWTLAGAKMSKSRGNIVDPFLIVQTYGADAFRYFLLHEVTLGLDGSYSEDLLRERYTSDLANDLGNLWFRLASMVDKYFSGQIPQGSAACAKEPLLQASYGLWTKVCDSMRANDPRGALDEIWAVVTAANQFVEEKKPWVLAKDPAKRGELSDALWVLAETLAHAGCMLQIFLPGTASKILTRLGLSDGMQIRDDGAFRKPLLVAGTKIERGDALFPKLEEEPD